MGDTATVVLLTTIAGAAIPLGGLLARIERIHPQWLEMEFRHTVMAFGGGVLLAAVALVLVPEGTRDASIPSVLVAFTAGGVAFLLLDRWLQESQRPASQLAAMLADFLPESLALGATFASDTSTGVLLAVLIALQNLPEGFNAWRELVVGGGLSSRSAQLLFLALVPLGPIAGIVGLHVLAPRPHVLRFVALFAAAGILYLTFQDIAPQAKLERRWAPSLGAVAGFLLGLVGQMLVG